MMPSSAQPNPARGAVSRQAVKDWIVTYLSNLLQVPAHEIDPTVDMDQFGLNSSAAVSMMGGLEDWLGIELSPAVLFEYPTIEAIAQHLEQEARSGGGQDT